MRRALVAVLLCALLPSCAGWTRWPWGTTQRWPEAMQNSTDPLPPGVSYLLEEGPEEALVVRHADPVKVRPTGFTAGYPLTFYDKSVRVHAGSAIRSAAGGRIEVVWPNGNSLLLFDEGGGVIGSPSKGQASFILLDVEGARIQFKTADQVELPTGIRLSAASGPFTVDRISHDVLRLSNDSKGPGEILFRDAVITLDVGQVVDLPLLSAGGKPEPGDEALQRAEGPGYALSWSGSVDMQRETDSVRLRALGTNEVRANGVRVRMAQDEAVRFDGLGKMPAERP
jgi:hypothetical protein